jgi:hypothetical protein
MDARLADLVEHEVGIDVQCWDHGWRGPFHGTSLHTQYAHTQQARSFSAAARLRSLDAAPSLAAGSALNPLPNPAATDENS